ncbi:hypothetical protein [Pelagicoccus sp. SDUM812002]|nr:hypothetical protein [Pelagicoccus sp. SDUM812002]
MPSVADLLCLSVEKSVYRLLDSPSNEASEILLEVAEVDLHDFAA